MDFWRLGLRAYGSGVSAREATVEDAGRRYFGSIYGVARHIIDSPDALISDPRQILLRGLVRGVSKASAARFLTARSSYIIRWMVVEKS